MMPEFACTMLSVLFLACKPTLLGVYHLATCSLISILDKVSNLDKPDWHKFATGCAFVQFRKWAEAEAAIDMHNAKTVLPGAEVRLVVKFADARKKDGFVNSMKRGILVDPWGDSKRQLGGAMPDAFLQVLSPHSLASAHYRLSSDGQLLVASVRSGNNGINSSISLCGKCRTMVLILLTFVREPAAKLVRQRSTACETVWNASQCAHLLAGTETALVFASRCC